MMRAAGILLLLGGGIGGAVFRCREIRTEQRQYRELAAFFRQADAEIGLHRTRLSDCLLRAAEDFPTLRKVLLLLSEQVELHPEIIPSAAQLASCGDSSTAEILSRTLRELDGDGTRNRLILEAAAAEAEQAAVHAAEKEPGRLAVCRAVWLGASAALAVLLG